MNTINTELAKTENIISSAEKLIEDIAKETQKAREMYCLQNLSNYTDASRYSNQSPEENNNNSEETSFNKSEVSAIVAKDLDIEKKKNKTKKARKLAKRNNKISLNLSPSGWAKLNYLAESSGQKPSGWLEQLIESIEIDAV